MKKITAITLAVVVFIGGFGAGNAYRSICKAEAVSQKETETEDSEETLVQDDMENRNTVGNGGCGIGERADFRRSEEKRQWNSVDG